jgi:colanic acid/amylovoran biosynthesis glycosyltransferase
MTLPRTAYVLLWFPKPSETFVLREVVNLWEMGLPLKVFTLYGELRGHLSPEMQSVEVPIERLGTARGGCLVAAAVYWLRRNRALTLRLLREVPFRRWNGFEKAGESLWAFFCAFRLARRFEEDGIEHIHAPWACGPATAAWVASRLTGIPFSFTGRAHDIYPPDGAIRDKIRDAVLVRTETRTGSLHLRTYTNGDFRKLRVTYNGVPLETVPLAAVPMIPPYRLLAIGRFVPTKGFDVLLRACHLLVRSGLDLQLTLAGDGSRMLQLRYMVRKLGLGDRVTFPGFVTHDRISGLFQSADLFVMPSVVDRTGNRDGLPTVILEALLHRVPVVATDVSGISEIIENGLTGILVPQRDAESLASAIRKMIGDRERAVAMAEHGRIRVREDFNALKNHRRLLGLYEDVLTPHRESSHASSRVLKKTLFPGCLKTSRSKAPEIPRSEKYIVVRRNDEG